MIGVNRPHWEIICTIVENMCIYAVAFSVHAVGQNMFHVCALAMAIRIESL